jgi:glycosyltransferase involved in cell wall biosynthesis
LAEELVRLLPAPLMRVAFHDPYLEILGGGEKVVLTMLEQVVEEVPEAEVTVLSPQRPDPAEWERLNVRVPGSAFTWQGSGMLGVTARSRGLDLLVVTTNHFPPLSLARRSAAVVQFPFADVAGLRGIERCARLRSYDTILCYSDFVREHIVRRLRISDAVVLAPPVDVHGAASAAERTRTILAVGRFFSAADANNKKHDAMIEAFSRLHPQAPGWELHLAGGCHSDAASQTYLATLREQAQSLPVVFHPNAEPAVLDDLYAHASLFWHATGYGETRPERLEHFGITTVEAMARGCVPVVPALGGQLEIVTDGVNGRLWTSLDDLVGATLALIGNPAAADVLRDAAVRDAARFTKERFRERFRELVLAPAGLARPARTRG